MRNQRAALEWVKDNIQSFGGDSTHVTAYGLSAGGTFISLQTMACGGESGAPFQQAWVMSGPPGTALNITSDATEHHTRAVAQKTGCGGLADPEMPACLRNLSMQELIGSAMEYSMANHPPARFSYDLSKDPEDPDITVHYFRLSRILRDILFTCSSIDFGYHMIKHTQKDINSGFSGVRLYDLNQSTIVVRCS